MQKITPCPSVTVDTAPLGASPDTCSWDLGVFYHGGMLEAGPNDCENAGLVEEISFIQREFFIDVFSITTECIESRTRFET